MNDIDIFGYSQEIIDKLENVDFFEAQNNDNLNEKKKIELSGLFLLKKLIEQELGESRYFYHSSSISLQYYQQLRDFKITCILIIQEIILLEKKMF